MLLPRHTVTHLHEPLNDCSVKPIKGEVFRPQKDRTEPEQPPLAHEEQILGAQNLWGGAIAYAAGAVVKRLSGNLVWGWKARTVLKSIGAAPIMQSAVAPAFPPFVFPDAIGQ